MSDDDILSDAKEALERAKEAESENRKDALEDWKFARLSEQWPERVRRDRELEGRPCLTINRLPSFIRQVVNDARQNKPGITVHPVDDDADPETAEIIGDLIRNIEVSSDADVAYDTALECACTGGFGYFKINTRYACDDTFDQDIAIERVVNPFSIYGDPNSTAADSSDWNDAFELELVTKPDFERRWKGADFTSFEDDGFIRSDALENQDSVVIASWWHREPSPRQIVALSDGNVVDLDVYTKNKALYDALGVSVVGKPRTVESHKVTQKLLSGGEVLEDVKWAGKYIPIVPVYGEEFNVEGKRHIRSLVRDAKDPQRMFNYWRTTSTELVALAPRAPFIGKKGAFETDSAKWATANTQTHAYIEYDGAVAPERQAFPGVPAGAIQEALNAADDLKSIMGIFDAAMGAEGNETSGRAILARQKEANNSNFHYIDNLKRAQRHAGRIILDLIPTTYPVERIIRTIGRDGKPQNVPINQPHIQPVMGPDGAPQMQPIPHPVTGQPQVDPQSGELMQEMQTIEKVYDLTTGKYDVTVESGPSFSTQREELNTVLLEMIRAVPESAPVLMDLVMKTFDLPDTDEVVARLKSLVPPQAQGGPDPAIRKMQQQLQAAMTQNAQLKTQLQQAKAASDIDAQRVQIEAYSAQTDRLEAMKPEPQPAYQPAA